MWILQILKGERICDPNQVGVTGTTTFIVSFNCRQKIVSAMLGPQWEKRQAKHLSVL